MRPRRPRPRRSAAELGARAIAERERRDAHDTARRPLTDAPACARRGSPPSSRRSSATGAGCRRPRGRRGRGGGRPAGVAVPVPAARPDLEAALTEAERRARRRAGRARRPARRAVRRKARSWPPSDAAAAARQAELETARRRAGRGRAAGAEEAERATAAVRDPSAEREAAWRGARPRARRRSRPNGRSDGARGGTRRSRRPPRRHGPPPRHAVAGRRGRAGARRRPGARPSTQRLAEEEERGIAKAARGRGGRRVDEELVVDPVCAPRSRRRWPSSLAATSSVRRPCPASPGTGARSSSRSASAAVARPVPRPRRMRAIARFRDALAGGGRRPLADAIRRDGTGAATRLLARVAWVPDLAAASGHPADAATRLGRDPA